MSYYRVERRDGLLIVHNPIPIDDMVALCRAEGLATRLQARRGTGRRARLRAAGCAGGRAGEAGGARLMDAIDIIGKGLLVAFLIAAVPYFIGFWFTRGVMAALRLGTPEAPRPPRD